MSEGQIEVTGRRGRRHKNLLEDFGVKRGCVKLKEKVLAIHQLNAQILVL